MNVDLNILVSLCQHKVLSSMSTLTLYSICVNLKLNVQFQPKNVRQKCLSTLKNSTLTCPPILIEHQIKLYLHQLKLYLKRFFLHTQSNQTLHPNQINFEPILKHNLSQT